METTLSNDVKVTAAIKKLKANKHHDIDAIEIESNGEPQKLNFPPHTAKAVMELVHEGDEAELTFSEEVKKDAKPHKKPKYKLSAIKSVKSGETLNIADIKPQKPGFNEEPESFDLKDYELIKDKKEELVGLKSGKNLFHIHKEDHAFAGLIKPGTALKIHAVKRTDDGFATAEHLTVYHIKTIVIDGKEFKAEKHK